MDSGFEMSGIAHHWFPPRVQILGRACPPSPQRFYTAHFLYAPLALTRGKMYVKANWDGTQPSPQSIHGKICSSHHCNQDDWFCQAVCPSVNNFMYAFKVNPIIKHRNLGETFPSFGNHPGNNFPFLEINVYYTWSIIPLEKLIQTMQILRGNGCIFCQHVPMMAS